MTLPFLENQYVLEMVLRDYIANLKRGDEASILSSLYNWIALKVKYTDDEEFQRQNKFHRNAKEIWESKLSTGCTDYALVFSTLARQIGVPTTILHTAEENWVKNLLAGREFKAYKGHTFCECFYCGEWVLVDPTARKVIKGYNPNKIELTNENNVYIPYLRTIDLMGKTSLKEHNLDMEERCKKLSLFENDIKIVKASQNHYEGIKDLLVQLQEYIVEIDKYKLNVLTKGYREGYFKKTLDESFNGGGTMLVAEKNGEVVGMVAGHMRKYYKEDRLDYSCPKMGIIEELIVKKGERNGGIGKKLVMQMEKYFADQGCEYVQLDVFAYNLNAYEFYLKENYEPRLLGLIKKLKN